MGGNDNQHGNVSEEKKQKTEDTAQNTKKAWLNNTRKHSLTRNRERFFKFGLDQDAASFAESNYMLANYSTISYKHNSGVVGKGMEDIKLPIYTETEEPADPTGMSAFKKWERKFDNYD